MVYKYQIFFFHLSISGCLGCSHALAATNNAAMNERAEASLWDIDFISFGYVPRSSIDESHGSSTFILGLLTLFSIATTPVYIPTNNTQAFPFLHTFAKLISGLFDNNHSSRYEMTASHLHFYFPNDLWCQAPSSVPVGHFMSSLN